MSYTDMGSVALINPFLVGNLAGTFPGVMGNTLGIYRGDYSLGSMEGYDADQYGIGGFVVIRSMPLVTSTIFLDRWTFAARFDELMARARFLAMIGFPLVGLLFPPVWNGCLLVSFGFFGQSSAEGNAFGMSAVYVGWE